LTTCDGMAELERQLLIEKHANELLAKANHELSEGNDRHIRPLREMESRLDAVSKANEHLCRQNRDLRRANDILAKTNRIQYETIKTLQAATANYEEALAIDGCNQRVEDLEKRLAAHMEYHGIREAAKPDPSNGVIGVNAERIAYPCGCVGTGSISELPKYCPEHGKAQANQACWSGGHPGHPLR
jgi:hypothetical protein